MAKVVKFFKTVRTNWKKSIFFTGVALYGAQWAKGKYDDSLVRTAYCLEARKYGETPLKTGEQARRVTVFLNPAARGGKGKTLFEKNVAPLLYLAGLEVTVVKTEYEGQAKKYMEVLENTDGILVAGGDGTLLEVVTGLLRRLDQKKASKIPVGIIPIGNTNRFANTFSPKDTSNVRWLAEIGMSIVRDITKPVDVMFIKAGGSKSIYAVSGLEWSAFQEAEDKKQKYWYFGPLKHRWTYIRSTLSQWPPLKHAELSYVLPCEGCSRCFTAPQPPAWRWWHFFLPPRIEMPKVDYSKVENEECGQQHSRSFSSLDFTALTANVDHKEPQSFHIRIGPSIVSRLEFIKEGWNRLTGQVSEEGTDQIAARQFTLTPKIPEETEAWFFIDNEEFEAMPVEVELLKDKIKMFYFEKPLSIS